MPSRLEEGRIIGLSWIYWDADSENEAVDFLFSSGVYDSWRTSAASSDFRLAPFEYSSCKPTSSAEIGCNVAPTTWGWIKQSMKKTPGPVRRRTGGTIATVNLRRNHDGNLHQEGGQVRLSLRNK